MIARFIIPLIFLLAISHADVLYEMITDYDGVLGITNGQMTIQMFVKGDKSRAIISIDNDGEIINSVSIIRFDLNKFWLLDEQSKEYEEILLSDTLPGRTTDTLALPEITVKKTGDKKNLLEFECEKIIVSMQDTADGAFFNFTETLWVSNEVPCYDELKNFTDKLTEQGLGLASASSNGDEKALREFQRKINEIDGFPLEFSLDVRVGLEEIDFSMNTVSTVTRLEEVPIHDRVFELPEGFTQKKAVNEAMRE